MNRCAVLDVFTTVSAGETILFNSFRQGYYGKK